eukprot:jgi/Botrbrau1/14305/Bobra.0207s0010.1
MEYIQSQHNLDMLASLPPKLAAEFRRRGSYFTTHPSIPDWLMVFKKIRGGMNLGANSYNQPICELTVTVRGRHPSLYRQQALSCAYRRSSHAANFLEYIRSGLERLRIAKSSIFRFRYIRRHLSVGAFKLRSLPWGDTTQHPREGKSIQSEANVYFWLYSLTRDFLRVLIGLESRVGQLRVPYLRVRRKSVGKSYVGGSQLRLSTHAKFRLFAVF